jgi:tetratricopeptide (TPR) repeat protein
MADSELLNRASALRAKGEYREAYPLFVAAADTADNDLEKAGILIDAITNLTQLHEFQNARTGLAKIRELLSRVDSSKLDSDAQDNFYRVNIWAEIEQAEILAAEDKLHEAIAKLTEMLTEERLELEAPEHRRAYDEVQCRRAYFLVDIGLWNKALPILQELESRWNENPIFLFSLGYCYQHAKEFSKARAFLERTLRFDPTPFIEFQAHCTLGMVLYELDEFQKAKFELETGLKKAPPRYIKDAKLWKWLENTCEMMGLKQEAEKYRLLASEPS